MDKTCTIWDLDGTLADVSHRLPFLQRKPKDWEGFFAAAKHDKLIRPTAQLMELVFTHAVAQTVVICTARPSRTRLDTEAWLMANGIRYNLLLMRKDNDRRPDTQVKRDMLDKIRGNYKMDVKFAVDDRPEVVRMWRDQGIPCFAVDDRSWYAPPEGLDEKQMDSLAYLRWVAYQSAGDGMRRAADELERLRMENRLLRGQFWEPDWRHVKRGSAYSALCVSKLQASNGPISEGARLMTYMADDGTIWSREYDEFNDGRFERIKRLPKK